MSFQLNVAPSQMAKLAKKVQDDEGEGEDEGPQRKKREDYKKLKELEEMRKAGTAPAMKDEEGRDINPHIPQYIMQAPWYYNAEQATLRHQRIQPEDVKTHSRMSEWYKRGAKEDVKIATKFRKGACENCGAMTHKKRDCLERPRKVTAKFSGTNFAPDEHLQPELDFDFEGKRDRWNGYDLSDHKRVIEEHHKIEEAKKLLKEQKFDTDVAGQEDDAGEGRGRGGGSSDDDEDKYAEDALMPGQKFETKQRITVRNLRIREDTAKYLHNLDTNSAHYDPKTRSMRENPFAGTGRGAKDVPYAGDNFVRYSGAAMDMARQQLFAWEAYEKGGDVHLQADPTKLEVLANEFSRRKQSMKTQVQDSILDKYGGQEHLEAPPKQLLMAQTEDYVEYSRHGSVIKGQEKVKVKSRYEEDVYLNNHTSVWGSYWHDGQWGFKCCHSLIKESYCTGEAGKQASVPVTLGSSKPAETLAIEDAPPQKSESEEEEEEEEEETPKKSSSKKKSKKKKKKSKKNKKKKRKESSSESSSSDSEDEDAARERRIKEAMLKEAARQKEVERLMAIDERKRPYNSMSNVSEPTEEEMEAFSRKKVRSDDPMANFL